MRQQINGLHVTQCICFPRSGHTWLMRMLDAYFGNRFAHCEMYVEPHRVIALDPTTNFQKNHDLALQTTIDLDLHYLIQARNPEDAIRSWYIANALGKDENTFRTDPPLFSRASQILQAHLPAYIEFRAQQMRFWEGFRHKWIFSYVPNSMILFYERLHADPATELSKVIKFLSEEPADPLKVQAAIQKWRKSPLTSSAKGFSLTSSTTYRGLKQAP